MDHTLALIGRAHQGDKEARDTLFEENMGLIYSVARRFLGRGVEMEDLVQIGSIGLLKAVDRFDPEFDVRFSTYAVPMIAGEIKRFLRDDGMIKVSRSIKETAARAFAVRERLERELGREATVGEISAELGISREELVLAFEASTDIESLQKTIYEGEGNDISLEDKIPGERDGHEELLNRLLLEQLLDQLEPGERSLILMRYFQEKTQVQIAEILGISQVQVSRLERRILHKLKGLG